jgi:hypothetical protein
VGNCHLEHGLDVEACKLIRFGFRVQGKCHLEHGLDERNECFGHACFIRVAQRPPEGESVVEDLMLLRMQGIWNKGPSLKI